MEFELGRTLRKTVGSLRNQRLYQGESAIIEALNKLRIRPTTFTVYRLSRIPEAKCQEIIGLLERAVPLCKVGGKSIELKLPKIEEILKINFKALPEDDVARIYFNPRTDVLNLSEIIFYSTTK